MFFFFIYISFVLRLCFIFSRCSCFIEWQSTSTFVLICIQLFRKKTHTYFLLFIMFREQTHRHVFIQQLMFRFFFYLLSFITLWDHKTPSFYLEYLNLKCTLAAFMRINLWIKHIKCATCIVYKIYKRLINITNVMNLTNMRTKKNMGV